jgi:hypothetical protein
MLSDHYSSLLAIHSILRWLILLSGIGAVGSCFLGISRKLPFAPLGRRAGLIYVSLIDTQFLVGVLLYFDSPLVHTLWADPAVGMKQHELRFFGVEHTTIMVIALILAHIGAIRSRRAKEALKAYSAALIWYAISLALILFGIPWWRPLLGY